MTQTATAPEISEISASTAAEIRAVMARKMVSQRALAKSLGVLPMWVTCRVNPTSARPVELTLDDVARIAGALGVPVRQLLHLDSNQKPFGYPVLAA